MSMQVIRAQTLAERAGAYYVRIQAMARKHHITLTQEFDAYDTEDTKYIVILDDVLPVATCRLCPKDAETILLGRVVVLPEYRGQGLGRLSVTAAEEWAAELGFRRAVLESRDNKVGFYQKLGYTVTAGECIHGETFTCIPMEKLL